MVSLQGVRPWILVVVLAFGMGCDEGAGEPPVEPPPETSQGQAEEGPPPPEPPRPPPVEPNDLDDMSEDQLEAACHAGDRRACDRLGH
ncbi:MAG: hypothetical protein ACOCV4_08225 [Myxococcota bacterium]